LEVLCVGVGFFLRTKATLQHTITSVIYDIICVSHGRVFTVFHPSIICYYVLYAVIVRIIIVYFLALV